MKYITIIVVLIFVSCAEYENVHTETEIIEATNPFNLTHKTAERAIREKHFRGNIVDMEIIRREPIGVSDNWFSGSSVFYEIEYRLEIHHYERVRVE